MNKIFLPLLFFSLFSCSGQVSETSEELELSPVIDQYTAFLDIGDYEGAVEMLTPLTIQKMSENIKDDLKSKKQIAGDDSLLNDKIFRVFGLSLEEAMSMNDTQLIALYLQKLPTYFDFDKNFVVQSQETIDSCKAFLTVVYQNGAIDTIFFEKHGDEWKIDLSHLVELAQFKAQVLQNAHYVQLAAEEFLYFSDSKGYPLTIGELNLHQGLKNPFNGDTVFLIFKENADKSEDPALEGYVTYFARPDSLYYLITAHGSNGKILMEFYPMPEIPAEN